MGEALNPSLRQVIRFGAFEVDVEARELRKQGLKTRLQEQPFQILLLLLARPGDVVTREDLRQQLWPADTFVDFEHSLNAAVKRLRDALGDSADNPRFIETLPRRGYRFLLPVEGPGRGAAPAPPALSGEPAGLAALPRIPERSTAAVLSLLLVAAGVTWWWLRRAPTPSRGPVLTRLTSDSGLTTDPAVSPDGKLLAYASDRSGDGNLDIWVQQMSGGEAIRLTRNGADDHEPAFSPDGTRIVFRSERDGGGIYVVSALGGDEKLLAREGRRPRFSPDGDEVAFWTGSGGAGGDFVAGTSRIYTVATTGGPTRQLRPEFATARLPVWSPDKSRILFLGIRDPRASPEDLFDWWVSPVAAGEPVRTGILGALRRHGLSGLTFPDQWVAGEDRVLFSDRLGDSTNLWQIRLSPGLQAAGAPERLSSGIGAEIQPSLAGDRLVFASRSENVDLWSLPLAANEGRVVGELRRLTRTAASHNSPSLSANGKTLAFISFESGKGDVWLMDLDTAKQTALTLTPWDETRPVLAADGSRVAYMRKEGGMCSIYAVAARGGAPERICEACTTSLNDWSSDKTKLLFLWEQPRRVALLNLETGQRTDILRHPRHHLYCPHFSRDGQWVTFLAQSGPELRQLFVIRFRGEVAVPESEWIAVTDGQFSDDKPRFSPDGNLLYFTSNRDGFVCLWGQRLEPATKRPLGSAFPIHHFHSTRLSMMNVFIGWLDIAVARDRVVFNLADQTGNIWMSRPEGGR